MLYSYKGNYPQELPETIVVFETVFDEVTHDVVTDENGFEEIITKTEIVGNNVNVEYTAPFSEELLARAGYVLVSDKPEDTDFIVYTWGRSGWVAEDSEAAKLRAEMWAQIRHIRDLRLNSFDGYVQKYIDSNDDIPQDLIDCRTQLRNIPQTYITGEINDWENVIWPDYAEEEN
jgi:hypothetical protein